MGEPTRRSLAAVTIPWFALAIAILGLVPAPVAAHGGTTGPHDHTVPVAVFAGGVLLLGASLAADRWGVLDRSRADVGVVAGGLGIVLSIALLWL